MSHGDYTVHDNTYENVRKAAADLGKAVAIMADLQGPKIRLGRFVDGKRLPKAGTERIIPADLVFLSLGFTGAEPAGITEQVSAEFDGRGNVSRDGYYMTNTEGIFVAGDAGRGQSLIVWAIAEGRACAAAVDKFLMGSTILPAPVAPTDRAIAVL
jgi:glutamate synthase (NADPH/NADH) small chain